MIYGGVVDHEAVVLLDRLRVRYLVHLDLLEVMLYVILIKIVISSRNARVPVGPLLAIVNTVFIVAFTFLHQASFALPALRLVFAHVHIHVHGEAHHLLRRALPAEPHLPGARRRCAEPIECTADHAFVVEGRRREPTFLILRVKLNRKLLLQREILAHVRSTGQL